MDDLLLQTFRLQHFYFCAMLKDPVAHGLFIHMKERIQQAILLTGYRKIIAKGIYQLIHHFRSGFQSYIHRMSGVHVQIFGHTDRKLQPLFKSRNVLHWAQRFF